MPKIKFICKYGGLNAVAALFAGSPNQTHEAETAVFNAQTIETIREKI